MVGSHLYAWKQQPWEYGRNSLPLLQSSHHPTVFEDCIVEAVATLKNLFFSFLWPFPIMQLFVSSPQAQVGCFYSLTLCKISTKSLQLAQYPFGISPCLISSPVSIPFLHTHTHKICGFMFYHLMCFCVQLCIFNIKKSIYHCYAFVIYLYVV